MFSSNHLIGSSYRCGYKAHANGTESSKDPPIIAIFIGN